MGKAVYLNGSVLKQWYQYHFLEKKLNTGVGYILLSAIGILLTLGVAMYDIKTGPVAVVFFAGILLLVLSMKNAYFSFYFLIIYATLTVFIDRLFGPPVPSGVLVEVITYFSFLSIRLKYDLKKNINRRFWTDPITISMYFLYAYYIIELFNPEMTGTLGTLGWFSFFRKQISFFLFYYLCYGLFDSRARIIYFIRFMILFTTLLALYACKQQWFGYAGFEMREIGTGNGMQLLFQAGLLRKFSVFSDPATSGILFASMSLLCVILFIRISDRKEKIWLSIAAFINLLGYSFSGTRTATLMILAGILIYCISTLYDRKTVLFLFFSVLAFSALIVIPFQNVVTARIRSTFNGTKDASASIRDYDRHEVQPYIQAHPLGGGIFTCGIEGPKYNKGHYLENLQPDSGFMKILAEQGAIGLGLLLIFYFIILQKGFYHFYRVKDPEIRSYYIGLLVMLFTLVVAQYAQIAIAQYPVSLFFYATMIIFIKLADFDTIIVSPNTTNQT